MLGEPPPEDTLEVTLFGPGYGESVLVHFGSGRWLLVDSCIDTRTRKPAALAYFDALQLDPADSVELILASHWHDDHIKGLASTVERCSNARVCFSSAFTQIEFIAAVTRFNKDNRLAGGSGVNELHKTYALLRNDKPAMLAIADRRLLSIPVDTLAHSLPVDVWALSPSDKQVEKFLVEIGFLLPQVKETKYRASTKNPNVPSVVLWISVGENNILLGGDLVETADQQTGWSAIVDSAARPQQRAGVFKIPHHGSQTGHSDAVWGQMIGQDAQAILTPFKNGSIRLPEPSDVERILGWTQNAHITSSVKSKPTGKRMPAVERTMKEMGVKLRPTTSETGMLRLRKQLGTAGGGWEIALGNEACHLSCL